MGEMLQTCKAITPENVRSVAENNVDGFFGELQCAAVELVGRYHPMRIARRHTTAVVVGSTMAGFLTALLIWKSRREESGRNEEPTFKKHYRQGNIEYIIEKRRIPSTGRKIFGGLMSNAPRMLMGMSGLLIGRQAKRE